MQCRSALDAIVSLAGARRRLAGAAASGGFVSVLRIARAVHDAIRAHAEETYPHECCGALLGTSTPDGWSIVASVAAENACVGSAQTRYQIAPADLIRIERHARTRGLDIGGFYHSHPGHPAQWSQTDLAEAHWIGAFYVITSVAQGKAAATNAFFLCGTCEEDKHFDSAQIQIVETA